MGLIVAQDRYGAKRHVRTGLASRQALVAYIFLMPALIYFTVFFFYPILVELWTSMQSTTDFVGLANYVQALQDQRVLESFKVTLIFAVCVTTFNVLIGLGLALLLDRPIKGRTIFRALFLVPYMTSMVIVGLMWRNILDPMVGIFNRILLAVGLPTQDWLTNYHMALPVIIGVTIWQGVGYTMVLFLAGLQGIPTEFYEAARVDGAGPWARFRYITLPLLAQTTLFVVIISAIGSLQAFAQAFIITQGGPADATRFFIFHVYNTAFNENNLGYASALTFLMFIVILVLTFFQLRVSKQAVEY
ncbi:multiple sugar transport system permease protein [Thermosporothrix hazakensis]|jgi:multiple sugar transport system permease protein|uniref:Multiple sugar transport system permease protein n=1 Tax=Thermosporothrix hazakensis TaxID=644383 RepID=A0A326TV92_THEHA|nr:sugar ABC transporter permease [Thermosporothrix hazakensis]PZW19334.1 multiple sugar transport system permease protein [Thermosporothrix hazakensis]GCE48228.1 glycerol-3-phosphate ABC transporter permease [Thermosporothrix hazakensis]